MQVSLVISTQSQLRNSVPRKKLAVRVIRRLDMHVGKDCVFKCVSVVMYWQNVLYLVCMLFSHILFRSTILILLGLVMNTDNNHNDLGKLRIPGVLQR